ncbi:acetylxylan esterase [Paenibacillus chitinolyticus]|uniref:acetylxylan esterase n=1 Tax=Paenibacillus chitinolyticus TaxID=79263 RepID=UPI003D062FC4
MNAVEKRIHTLHQYKPALTLDPSAADHFWDKKLDLFKNKPLNARVEQRDSLMHGVDTYHVTYEGFDETPVHGWFLVPSFMQKKSYPCLVMFPGYTADKGLPERYAAWLLQGFAVFAVDVRGQGGETGNRLDYDAGTSTGWMTQNILDKDRCYYMAVTLDAYKAVEWAAGRPEVRTSKIAVVGGSQGGGLSLITGALHEKVSLIVADIPNMCHMDFGVLNSVGSLKEAADFIKRNPDRLEPVFETLAHFDMMNLAHRIRVPVRMTVGLKDMVCWPESIFAAYNRIEGDKHIDVHPFSGHEVSERQQQEHRRYLAEWAREAQ